MGKQDVSVDAEVFARTTSLFALKRNSLPPETVETLASDIVRRLATSGVRASHFEDPVISDKSVAAFCDALVRPDPIVALQFIEDRRAEGLTREGVYFGYI